MRDVLYRQLLANALAALGLHSGVSNNAVLGVVDAGDDDELVVKSVSRAE